MTNAFYFILKRREGEREREREGETKYALFDPK
jgi:hypothetical protein